MNGVVVVHAAHELGDNERAALEELTQLVYPPDEWRDWPGWRIEWSQPQWCVRVFDSSGMLAAHVGLVVRAGWHDGQPATIAGIGGVKTHPARRGLGFASRALQRAGDFVVQLGTIDFQHLVCENAMKPFYARLGWSEFQGKTVVLQHGEPTEFTFLGGMVRGAARSAPSSGLLDLGGPPW